MAPITTFYGITGPVPFLDVDIAVDNRMFVDPHAIRLHGASDRFAVRANECTESFFEEILQCVFAGNERRGLWLLQRFLEPWETRLGLAQRGFSGHGGAEDVGSWIWRALNHDINALLQVGLLKQIEDLPLFIEGIDRDITSDITTRIIFEALAEFTSHMIDRFPQFNSSGHRVDTFQCQAWDSAAREWAIKSFDLPVAGGKPLLLVPHSWARSTLLMSATRYYETKVLDYAQLERAVRLHTGKLVKTPKDQLMTEPGLGRGRVTNLNVTRRAHANNDDLIAKFKQFVDMKWTPPSGDNNLAA
ncbi:hypothetical protein OPAG_08125 [Rhodococcus opacus PD630]|uniref:hypothetical protein n=1 Tax=Rhodococcus opacus TaxID=37919 RepID=UPI00029CCF1D|nr:hypothetical protein [Rhodococcus opacus]AHK35323.1 hypothetical protein Pd630_LPD09083 [Rhodococcus opacus PD630]EHI41305.1 hypothetical protein OPAG_08125 [Rhodococcus opacus PD630]UDH01629.1 hypothetical protein K2Z90_008206 [Rhodococcus opacus PD630]